MRDALGIRLWPTAVGASEPLDCDEAAYAYIGHRILHGDVMYRDLTENKPPLGYWLYTLAVAVGGYHELAIRVMPIPFVLATIALVWWIALRLGGPGSACLAGGALRDPEHRPVPVRQRRQPRAFHQLFRGRFARALDSWMGSRRPMVARGFGRLSGCGHAGQAGRHRPRLRLRRGPRVASLVAGGRHGDDKIVRGLVDVGSFGLGLVSILVVAAAILIAQGAGAAAYDDIFHYGRALATDTLPEPNAPPGIIRWITGNADPKGRLPWPFGTTNYLVWWGTASWPFWLVSIPALAYLLLAPAHNLAAAAGRGLDAGGLGPGRPAGSLLAALLPLADRRRSHRRRGLLRPTRLRFLVAPFASRDSISRRQPPDAVRNVGDRLLAGGASRFRS